jgi:hypothetical protein
VLGRAQQLVPTDEERKVATIQIPFIVAECAGYRMDRCGLGQAINLLDHVLYAPKHLTADRVSRSQVT